MACCGQRAAGSLIISQKDIDDGLVLELEYQGSTTVIVHGPVTGRSYRFSRLEPLGAVDPRDAPGLLRDRQFRFRGIQRPEAMRG